MVKTIKRILLWIAKFILDALPTRDDIAKDSGYKERARRWWGDDR